MIGHASKLPQYTLTENPLISSALLKKSLKKNAIVNYVHDE